MNIKQIVEKYLTENNLDGLAMSDCCACKIDDLMPCDEPSTDCVAGKIKTCGDWCEDINSDGTCIHGWDWCIEEK